MKQKLFPKTSDNPSGLTNWEMEENQSDHELANETERFLPKMVILDYDCLHDNINKNYRINNNFVDNSESEGINVQIINTDSNDATIYYNNIEYNESIIKYIMTPIIMDKNWFFYQEIYTCTSKSKIIKPYFMSEIIEKY